MKDLVTEAAIEAAGGPIDHELIEFMTVDEQKAYRRSIKKQLERAAPFIAAEALRQAAQKLFADRAARGTGYVSREVSDYLDGIEVSAETLIALANELEGK